jgi:hypothetical protein
MKDVLLVLSALSLSSACAAPIRLADGAGLTESNTVKLRVDGAATLSRAIVVRRVDTEWGPYGNEWGSHFNNREAWSAKVDFPAGPHEIEVTHKDIRGVVFKAVFQPNVVYNIQEAENRPNCLQLVDGNGAVIQEECYVQKPAQQCTDGTARLLFSKKEMYRRTEKSVDIVLQKVDDTYGPNRLGFGWGLNYYNDRDSESLDVRVCAGSHALVFGVRIEGYVSVDPITAKGVLEANKTYKVVVLERGIDDKASTFWSSSVRFAAVKLFIEEATK